MSIKPFLPERKTSRANPIARAMVRSVIAMGSAHSQGRDALNMIDDHFDGDPIARDILAKGAVSPLTTSTSNAPVSTALATVGSVLGPAGGALGGILSLKEDKIELGRAGSLTLPVYEVDGSGVAYIPEAGAFPFAQLELSDVSLTHKKVGSGIAITRELFEHSAAEAMLTSILQRNLALGFDRILLDATASSTTRPAGLKAGLSAVAESAASGSEAMIEDLSTLAQQVAVVSTNIVFIMPPKQYISFMLRRPSDFKIPVLCSGALADDEVACLAIDAFAIAGSGDAQFKLSRTATAVLDTNAGDFSTPGSPNAVSAPIKSALQSDLVMMRLTASIDWALQAPEAFAWSENVAW